ncbi:MAG: ABC transporter permease [Treponema sp.]|jgi:peptide/nickel transport system permease protein|nr:ABC transporter permease [Treponema sp.]
MNVLKEKSLLTYLWKNHNGNLRAGLIMALIITVLVLAGLFFLPFDYNEMDSHNRFKAPGFPHLMGTDNFGRDVFSRIMAGGRYTLLTAFLTVAGSAAIGSILGMFAGLSGGLWDEITMRFMDALSSFPGILIALITVTLLDTGALVTALLILFIPSYTRVMRSGTLQYRNRDFILAARIIGTSKPRILFVHILPNLLPSLLSASVLGLSNAILAESTMSYLGLGIQPPEPSWGRMLAESQSFLFNAPWCAAAPGLMIILAVLTFHYLGEGLRPRNQE